MESSIPYRDPWTLHRRPVRKRGSASLRAHPVRLGHSVLSSAGHDSLAVIRFMSPSARSPAKSDLSIRTMRPDEISIAVNWAAAEGWNPGLADDACFAAADPESFFIGELDGAPAATVSCVNYGASFAFLGFYIVRQDLRGRGYGLRVWRAAIAQAGARVIGLDGVGAQQQNYRRAGGAAYDATGFPPPRTPFLLAWSGSPGRAGSAL